MHLYLIRHGQTDWNAAMRAQGHSNVPLNQTGLTQANLLGRAFRELNISQVLTSDMDRAIETARPIIETTGAKHESLPALRERCFGDYEGLVFSDMHQKMDEHREALNAEPGMENPMECFFNVKPPNGESFLDVWNRLQSISERLLEIEEPTVVVGHGASCALMLAQLLKGSILTSRAFRFENTSITELIRRPEGNFQMVRFNCIKHLESDKVKPSPALRGRDCDAESVEAEQGRG